MKTFYAEYAVDGTAGGSIGAILIDRDDLNGIFHAVCDKVSQDLQHVRCQFCDSDGYCRVQIGDHAASTGGFLYIISLQLPAAAVAVAVKRRGAGVTQVELALKTLHSS
jgi:hypothetical protein